MKVSKCYILKLGSKKNKRKFIKKIGEKLDDMQKEEESYHQFAKLARITDSLFFAASLIATIVRVLNKKILSVIQSIHKLGTPDKSI